MPFAYPSHQGLIAFLWRRWPGVFDVPALCIGAAMPDVVDGVAGAFRGHLGQWYGHTLIGLLLCVPGTMVLTWVARLLADAFEGMPWCARAAAWILDDGPRWVSSNVYWWRVGVASLVGSFSHLFFDFISHGNFLWFYPWYEDDHFFPAWWYTALFEIRLPGYPNPFPAGPYLAVWMFLSLLGIVLLFWPMWRRKNSKDQ